MLNTQHVPSIYLSELQQINTEFVKSFVFNVTWGEPILAGKQPSRFFCPSPGRLLHFGVRRAVTDDPAS